MRVYNGAGELVYVQDAGIGLYQEPTGLVGPSQAIIPDQGDVAAIGLVGTGQTFNWNGFNANGQMVEGGLYTVRVEMDDGFGNKKTYNIGVTVLRAPGGIKIQIFNSAGELVRQFSQPSSQGAGFLRLSEPTSTFASGNGAKLEIRYGNAISEAVNWDGTNSAGQLVGSGTYYVRVEQQEGGKGSRVNTVAITVLRTSGNLLSDAFIAPNPLVPGSSGLVTLHAPSLSASARLDARVYNTAGELVMHAWAAGSQLSLNFGSKPIAGGVYLVRVDAEDGTGLTEGRVLKLAIAK